MAQQQFSHNQAFGNAHQHNGNIYGNVNHYGGTAQDLREQVMSSLYFPGMWTHHSRPLDAQEGTDEWIFDDEETTFSEWLRSDDFDVASRRFWIHGKAGCGKSTLMKFISESARTISTLKQSQSATGRQLIVAKFFAWSAGGTLGRTMPGLLRSLLFQLLETCTASVGEVEMICPSRCKFKSHAATEPFPWSTQKLTESVQRIMTSCGDKFRFLFFFDGIDELDEATKDPSSIVKVLNSINKDAAVKVCISSRPLKRFETAYGDSKWQIAVHQHTYSDIAQFVNEKLREDLSPAPDPRRDNSLDALSHQICKHANGVFLWVALAVQTVRRGLDEGDDIAMLEQRIRDFPKVLEEFFWRIFDKTIVSSYQKYAARTLILIQAGCDDPVQLAMLKDDADDSNFAIAALVKPVADEEWEEMVQKAQTKVRSWCRELIMIDEDGGNIMFCHRSMKDFVDQKGAELRAKAGADFHLTLTRFRVWVRLLKFPTFGRLCPPTIECDPCFMRDVFSNWQQEQVEHQRELLRNLQEIDNIGNYLSAKYDSECTDHWTQRLFYPRWNFSGPSHCFLSYLLACRLDKPFWALLDGEHGQEPEPQSVQDFWLECAAIPLDRHGGFLCAEADVVRSLIKRGANVSACCSNRDYSCPAMVLITDHIPIKVDFPGRGIWPQLLVQVWRLGMVANAHGWKHNALIRPSLENMLSVVEVMLENDCDPDVMLQRSDIIVSFEDELSWFRPVQRWESIWSKAKGGPVLARDLFDPALILDTVPDCMEEDLAIRTYALRELKWLYKAVRAALDVASQKTRQSTN